MAENECREKAVPCEIEELGKTIEATFKLATALQTGLANVLLPAQANPSADCENPIVESTECPLAISVRAFRRRVEEVRAVLEETLLRLDA